MSEFANPQTVLGVDFSAANDDAGRNTWIAECSATDDRLRVDCLADAVKFLDCDPRRDSTLPALVDLVVDETEGPRAVGLDFPFGLPRRLLDDGEDWRAFLRGTPDRWGVLEEVDGPRTLFESARAHANGHDAPLLRATDATHNGQEPTGFRIKTQTYYGVSGVLAEVASDVSIVPMDEPIRGTLVLETYPAAVFRRLDGEVDEQVFDRGYKRDTREAIERRRANVAVLEDARVEFGPYRVFAVASDDALDAVAAAYATWRATWVDGLPEEIPDRARREGYIFA